MVNITAAMVKELREMTGAGMMDCKKALGETDGDMDAGANIVALQYIDGQWVDVPVVEVRADHVVLGAVKNGKVAFVLK